MVKLTPWKRRKSGTEQSNRLPEAFGRFFDEPFFPVFDPFNRGEWWPRVDVSEGRSNITVEAEIPGMDKDEIDLAIEGRNLHIKGRKSRKHEENDEGYYRVERAYGSFNRVIELPAEVDESSIDAKYKRGVLKVKIKKQKDAGTKSISITSS